MTLSEENKFFAASLDGFNLKIGSLLDYEFCLEITQGCSTVIHLAAAQHEASKPDRYFFEVNAGGTDNLIRAAIANSVGRFLYGSTIGVYGTLPEETILETSRICPENAYTRSKAEAESIVRSYGDSIRETIIRIGETYGPGDFRLKRLFGLIEKRAFIIIGNGLNTHQPIEVDDLCGGLLLGATRQEAIHETFIMAGKETLSTQEMCISVARSLGVSERMVKVPAWPFVAAAEIADRVLLPMNISFPIYSRRLDFFRKSYCFSIDKAKSVLGFDPKTNFEDGSKRMARWYLQSRHM